MGFIMLGIMVSLLVGIYAGFGDTTGFTSTADETVEINGVDSEGNIMEQFNRLGLITGMNEITSSVQKITNPSANFADIIGAFGGIGIGIVKVLGGIITLPFTMGSIILTYYSVPPILITGIGTLFIVSIGFIMLNLYLKTKV